MNLFNNLLATIPAGATTALADASAFRDDVWAFILASIAFAVIVGWALKLRGKRG